MSICQRKTGAWLVKYKDPQTGRWLQRQFKTRQLAEEFDASASYAASKDEPLSLREAVTAYIQGRSLCSSRVKTLLRLVNQSYASHLADRYVDTLNRQDLESIRSKMVSAGLKTTTINAFTGALRSILGWCASEDLIERNPWERYRNLPGARYEHRTGTMEDLRKIYSFLPGWLQWAVRTAMALCLRPGLAELFPLRWKAFDWRARAVEVYMPKVRRTKLVFPPAWYLDEARQRFVRDGERLDGLVCPSRRGRQVQARGSFIKAWHGACKKAGASMPFYAIRHIAASEMLANGADLAAVAAQLGHSDISTTASFYTHAIARAQKSASLGIPALGA